MQRVVSTRGISTVEVLEMSFYGPEEGISIGRQEISFLTVELVADVLDRIPILVYNLRGTIITIHKV
jgi:predicted transcriptional regulator